MSTIKSSDEHLTLNADGSSKDIKFQANGVEKASISSAGVLSSDGGSTHADNVKAKFGTGNDLEIYHDGTHSYIKDVGTGDLRIKGTDLSLRSDSQDEPYINCTENGAVKLYYNNSQKFETTDEGAKVTGHLRLNNSQQIQFGGSATHIDGDSGYMAFDTSSAEAMRLDSAGRLLIGTTAASIVNDSGLRVRADSYGQYAAQIAHRKDNGDCYGLDIDIENYTGTAGQIMIRFQTSGGAMGNIKATQNAVQYNSNSDYRLKENVDYTWDATTRLKQLKPARFNFKNDDTNTLVDGFLAHEVSSVVPNAINGVKDATETFSNVVLKANGRLHDFNVTEAEWEAGKLTDEYDSNSTWVASHTQDVNQEMDNSKLVPLLVKTIQELEARITALES
jgi:hypothetical protein